MLLLLLFLFFQEGDIFVQFVYKWEIQAKSGLMMWNISGEKKKLFSIVKHVHVPCLIAIQQVCVEMKKKYLRDRVRSLADDGRLAVSKSFPAAPKGSALSLSLCVYKLYSNQTQSLLSVDLQMHSCYQSWLTVCTKPMYN